MLIIEPIEKSILLKEEDVGLIKKVDVLRAILIGEEADSDLNHLYQVIESMKPITCGKCVHWNSETNGCKRNPSVEGWKENDSCSYGSIESKE